MGIKKKKSKEHNMGVIIKDNMRILIIECASNIIIVFRKTKIINDYQKAVLKSLKY